MKVQVEHAFPQTGTVVKNNDKFGFISLDDGGPDMFVMPTSCPMFGGSCPPIGTRVRFMSVVDEKTGRPRAENVEPVDDTNEALGALKAKPSQSTGLNVTPHADQCAPNVAPGGKAQEDVQTGTMVKDSGKFGFIEQDSGGEDMFVMPANCPGFGGRCPPLGAKVSYRIVSDAKTGRPRAEDVMPADDSVPMGAGLSDAGGPAFVSDQLRSEVAAPCDSEPAPPIEGDEHTGTMLKDSGAFGFIRQDSGEPDMFVMPSSCPAFGGRCPPIGTRLRYIVKTDQKTGRPRAESVQAADDENTKEPPTEHLITAGGLRASQPGIVMQQVHEHSFQRAPAPGRHRGTTTKNNWNFGFIQQDSGDRDIFVLPANCVAFGSVCPPVGSRVCYSVGVDPKTGMPRAEDVEPLGDAWPIQMVSPVKPTPSWSVWSDRYVAHQQDCPASMPGVYTGTMLKDNGRFGFIQQDSGEPDMFVTPSGCPAFGGCCPPIGTRVLYIVVTDQKTGRPRAENVAPAYEPATWPQRQWANMIPSGPAEEAARVAAPARGLSTGTFVKNSGAFGFIRQDSGEDDMFVIASSCRPHFAGEFPPIGTRVAYNVIIDAKTGKPRAEGVHEEAASFGPSGYGAAGPLRSRSVRSQPYSWDA